ncbi:MAG TPA: multicopper oxidase domain-containing protein [Vicinamibacterales bacterium]|nr:multicopper oxidase domain-containing protein [Vicinamibacterales bacterium]
MRHLCRTFVAAAVLAHVVGRSTHAQVPAALPPSHDVHPTVTAAMGDVGGRFFGRVPDPARTRHYYIAAEPQIWDYAPAGCQVMCADPPPLALQSHRKGAKLRYVQYTDATFQARVFETPRLGLLGPVLRGTVGDYLAVTFLNRTPRPLSMHPHGLKYDKDSEGSHYEPNPGRGAAVGPGATFTYVWQLDAASGPDAGEPSSKGWLYHSHVNGDEETALGLVGFIIVTDPRRARADGTPQDVDREIGALFMINDESGLGEAEKEAVEHAMAGRGAPPRSWAEIQQQLEQGRRYAINGYIFGNLPGLEVNEGERVRWYLFGLGSEQDVHTAHWHGLRVIEEGRRRTDVVDLLPATMKVADMVADNAGTWLFHCHVAEHMMEGMFAPLVVHARGESGGNRAPDPAFFGLRQSERSLTFTRAEAIVARTGDTAPFQLRLAGVVSVYDAFPVFGDTIRVQLGQKAVSFKPDPRGAVSTPEVSFRATNANAFGVVYSGRMEFEVTLTGADWQRELERLGFQPTGARPPSLDIPLTLEIGRAKHTATARLAPRP